MSRYWSECPLLVMYFTAHHVVRNVCETVSLHLVSVCRFGGIVASLSRRWPQTHCQWLSLPGNKSWAVPWLAFLLCRPIEACIFKVFYWFWNDGSVIWRSWLAEFRGRWWGVGLDRQAVAVVCCRLGGGGVRQDVPRNNWSGKNIWTYHMTAWWVSTS